MIYDKFNAIIFDRSGIGIRIKPKFKLVIVGISLYIKSLNPETMPTINITRVIIDDRGREVTNVQRLSPYVLLGNNTYLFMELQHLEPPYRLFIPKTFNNRSILPIHSKFYKHIDISATYDDAKIGSIFNNGTLEADVCIMK